MPGTGGDLAQTVEELQKQIKGFATMEEKFKQQLASFIKQETKQAAAIVGDALKQEINLIADKFVQIVRNTEIILRQYEWAVEQSTNRWKEILTPLGIAVTGGMVAVLLVYFASGGFDNPRSTAKTTAAPQSVQYVHKKAKSGVEENEGQ